MRNIVNSVCPIQNRYQLKLVKNYNKFPYKLRALSSFGVLLCDL